MPRRYQIALGALLVLALAILAWRALTPAAPQTVAVVIVQGAAIPDRLTLAPGRSYRLAIYSIGIDRWLAGSGAPRIHAAADRITYADFKAPTAGFWTLQATNGAAQLQIDVAASVPPARSRTLLVAAGRIIGAGPVATGGQVNLATPDAQATLSVDGQERPLSAGRIERWDAPAATGQVQLATADERLALPIRRAETKPAPFVGALAPAFSLPRLGGGTQTLDNLRGRGVV
ncbi:MAG TPA: hypothetical protein VFK80_07940, partial [Limnochordia bacterium]|nr:hypothetical protein [Limnochordia bacterium]